MISIIEPITGDLQQDNELLAEYLRRHLPAEVQFEFLQIPCGFSTIESEFQGLVNGAQAALLFQKALPSGCRGVVVDCFDDPGVVACREIGGLPVVGPYQAAVSVAAVLSDRIGIITTDLPGITNEEKKARSFGVENKIVSIRAIDSPVGDILADRGSILEALLAACRRMELEDRVGAICLGCTEMFFVADELKRRLKAEGSRLSVVEPILNAVLMLENIIRMGCSTDIPVATSFDGYTPPEAVNEGKKGRLS